MIEINLIPDVKQELLRTQRVRARVISMATLVSIIAVGVVVALLVYMFAVQGVRNIFLDDQISSKGKEFSQVEDLTEVLTIQNQLAAISDINAQKNMSSRIFALMTAITPPGENTVSFSRISVGTSVGSSSSAGTDDTASAATGSIQLEGQTTGFNTMEVLKKTIENTVVQYTDDEGTQTAKLTEMVNAGDISYGEDTEGRRVLRFALTFDYIEELFSPNTKDISFKLNVNGNVTDSYIGIPRFTERARDLEGDQ